MIGQLEGQVQVTKGPNTGEFNSQHVANTLWAYATMERKPGERVMWKLEGRSEEISEEFKAQEVANTMGVCNDNGRRRRDQGSSARRLLQTQTQYGRVEAISGEFSNILYEPREWLNKQHER